MRICLVGTGSIAQEHVENFIRIGGVEFDTVISRLRESAEEFARRYGDENLSRELSSLSAHLYCDSDQSVSFSALARGLKAARGRYQARPAAVSVSALPSLNP